MANEPVVHVIDDDEAMCDSLDFMLDAAGVKARTWESAVAFVDALPAVERGCIVTDVRMPDMTGLELVQRLKQLGHPDPVIVITGFDQPGMRERCLTAGAAAYLIKPLEGSDLSRELKLALSG